MAMKISQINQAIIEGIDSIIKEHPRFSNFEKYFLKHIDKKKIKENIQYLKKRARTLGFREEKGEQYIIKEIADYVSSGEAFDEKGKNIILKNGLEEKIGKRFWGMPSLREMFGGQRVEGVKYIDKAIGAYNELYKMAKSGGYNLPEKIEKPMDYLTSLGFSIPAVNLLKETGLINRGTYSKIRRNIKKGIKEGRKDIEGGLEEITKYKVASILGLFGISLIILSSRITGAVVGFSNKSISCIIGACMAFASLLLIFNLLKKKIKN